jgi:transposase
MRTSQTLTERDLRLLVDHREDLVAERTRAINRLRWHLHELDPQWDPKARSLDRIGALADIAQRLAAADGTVARIARTLVAQCQRLTTDINSLDAIPLT